MKAKKPKKSKKEKKDAKAAKAKVVKGKAAEAALESARAAAMIRCWGGCVTGGSNGQICVWDCNPKGPEVAYSFSPQLHGGLPISAIVGVSSDLFLSAGHDGLVQLWYRAPTAYETKLKEKKRVEACARGGEARRETGVSSAP